MAAWVKDVPDACLRSGSGQGAWYEYLSCHFMVTVIALLFQAYIVPQPAEKTPIFRV